MHTAQLNSGSFRQLIPIGEDGSPVWRNAEAFVNAIEREPKLGESYARFLSRPRFNEQADHVDWYVPFPPVREDGEYLIVSWQSASPEEKSAALRQLSEFERGMLDFGYDLEARSLDSNNLLFAHYLTGRGHAQSLPALHFPDENCLFIVDGQPVITFWGFCKSERSLLSSPFAALRPSAQGAAAAGAGPAASSASKPTGRTSQLWWLLPLLLLLLLLLLWWIWQRLFAPDLPLFSVRPNLEQLSLEPVVQGLTLDDEEEQRLEKLLSERYDRVVLTDPQARGSVLTDGVVSAEAVPAGTLPELAAEAVSVDGTVQNGETQGEAVLPERVPEAATEPVTASQDPQVDGVGGEEPQLQEQAPDGLAPQQAQDGTAQAEDPAQQPASETQSPEAAKDADPVAASQDGISPGAGVLPPELKGQGSAQGEELKLDSQDLSTGNLKVLDGNWASRSGLVDAKTGKPVNVEYSFKNGAGKATVTRADGSKCQTEIKGSYTGGALNIDHQGQAKCADGSSYNLPKVTCKPDQQGKTNCVGSYDNQEQVKMQLFR